MTRPYRRHGRGFYVPDFTPSLQIVAQFSCTCEKLIMKWSKPVTDYLLYMQFIAVVTSLFVCLFTRTLLTLFKKNNNQKEPVAAASWRLEPMVADQSAVIVGRFLSLFLSQTNVAFT